MFFGFVAVYMPKFFFVDQQTLDRLWMVMLYGKQIKHSKKTFFDWQPSKNEIDAYIFLFLDRLVEK